MLSDLKDPAAPPAAREIPDQLVHLDRRDCLAFQECLENLDPRVLCLTSSHISTGSSCHRERTKVPTPSDTCRLRSDPWGPEVHQVNLESRVLRVGWDPRGSTETEVLEVLRVLRVREETEDELGVMASLVLTAVTERKDLMDLPGLGVCRAYRECLEPGDTAAGAV